MTQLNVGWNCFALVESKPPILNKIRDLHRSISRVLITVAAVCMSTWLFWPASRFGFLDWDDAGTLLRGNFYHELSWRSLRWMFTTHQMGPYQPLAWLSFAINYKLCGLHPGAYHMTNIFLHAMNAGLFAVLAMELLPETASGIKTNGETAWRYVVILWTALAYALHPLRVESVAWATERRDVLCGFFFLMSVLAYMKEADEPGRRARAYYAIAVVAGVCAMLSKGIAVGLPVVLWMLDRGKLGRGWADWKSKIPFLLAAAVVSWLNLLGARSGDLPQPPYSLLERMALCGNSIQFYVCKSIWPAGLSPYYQMAPKTMLWGTGILWGALVGALLSLMILALGRRWPAFWWSWLAYLALLAPVSGLFPNGQFMVADRYSYLAAMPLTLLAGAGLCRVSKRYRPGASLIMAMSIGAIFWVSRSQLGFWENNLTLWSRATRVTPSGDLAWYNLATSYMKEGKTEPAKAAFREALIRAPDSPDAHYNLGLLEEAQGHWRSAADEYQAALQKQPGRRDARHQLALVHLKMGDMPRATQELEELLRMYPDFAEASFNLGMIYWRSGRQTKARPLLQNAVHVQPELASRLPY